MANIMLKAKYSLISALVFFIVANPEFYKFTDTLFGWLVETVTAAGAPTPMGIVLHSVIFFAAMLGLMMVPNL
jgi:hypothetical protein